MVPRIGALLATALLLGACSTVVERDGPGTRQAPRDTPNAVPREEPRSKYGNPDSYVVFGKRYYTLKSSRGFVEKGIASWYGKKFHGRRTSSGEVYDMYAMSAAHKHLPLPTYVEVRNIDNGRTAVVKVNDRGPFHDNRVIDLSFAAATKLGFVEKGTAFVEVRALDPGGKPAEAPSVPVVPPAEMPSGVYLQIGAFQDRANAERLAERIRGSTTTTVHIREIESRGRVLYRVQIGPVASVESADAIVAALEELGIEQHYFVTE